MALIVHWYDFDTSMMDGSSPRHHDLLNIVQTKLIMLDDAFVSCNNGTIETFLVYQISVHKLSCDLTWVGDQRHVDVSYCTLYLS